MEFDTGAFAAKVRARRAELDITQAELASRAGIAVNTVSLTEKGETEPKLDTVCKLALGLGVTPNEIAAWGYPA